MPKTTNRPRIVCLVGSTRFYREFRQVYFTETLAGHIVLSVGFDPDASEDGHGETIGITEEQKVLLDRLHLRKIDLADEIFVISVDGYIGESTSREIAYAQQTGKPVRWLESIAEARYTTHAWIESVMSKPTAAERAYLAKVLIDAYRAEVKRLHGADAALRTYLSYHRGRIYLECHPEMIYVTSSYSLVRFDQLLKELQQRLSSRNTAQHECTDDA